jgi:hypothetical protein
MDLEAIHESEGLREGDTVSAAKGIFPRDEETQFTSQ